jgi:putative lipoic acid-binding regulatory protein
LADNIYLKWAIVNFRLTDCTEREVSYPAEFHLRVICIDDVNVTRALRVVLESYNVTAELTKTNQSHSGRYQSYGVSIKFMSREDMVIFDREVRAIPGVRMLL